MSGGIYRLGEPEAALPALAGGKASRLAALKARGHPVPEGVVVTQAALSRGALLPAARVALGAALEELGGPVAVRSSASLEDLETASFAGQYETVLGVAGIAAVEAAIGRCLASAGAPHVAAYRRRLGLPAPELAVLVQRLIRPTAAGVAFTAHPVTGERGMVSVSAGRGLGDALASGSIDAEEWEVRPGAPPACVRSGGGVLAPEEAGAVAALALRVAGGAPFDVEWALEPGGSLWLMQARPMTAVPEPASWDIEERGTYARNFRLGEWIGAPLTPLTESWLVTGLEEALHRRVEVLWGMGPPRPLHVMVNGWYFYGGMNYPVDSPRFWLRCLPTMARNLPRHFHEMMSVSLKPLGFHREADRWRRALWPEYQAVVAGCERELLARAGRAQAPAGVLAIFDELLAAAGRQFTSIVGVAGYSAGCELGLMAWLRRHAPGEERSVHELVVGAEVTPRAHDVEGLDLVFPTLGERGPLPPPPSAARRAQLLERRAAAEARVRARLRPRALGRFERKLAEARAAHAVRQEQTGAFTLAWPALRAAALRLGEACVAAGVLTRPEDIHFLRRDEVVAALAGGAAPVPVAARRALWERQRKLAPPLYVGPRAGLFKRVWDEVEEILHHPELSAPDALAGTPASPGRVAGVARVVRSVDGLVRLGQGEVLVAPVTTPAWTAAFSRAAAIVTDTGSIASHASIVAREHGIPAVVGTGVGTARIVDGQRITVDGSVGVVRLA